MKRNKCRSIDRFHLSSGGLWTGSTDTHTHTHHRTIEVALFFVCILWININNWNPWYTIEAFRSWMYAELSSGRVSIGWGARVERRVMICSSKAHSHAQRSAAYLVCRTIECFYSNVPEPIAKIECGLTHREYFKITAIFSHLSLLFFFEYVLHVR